MTSVPFDPSDLRQRTFDGYGPAMLPDPRDDAVRAYVNGVIAGGRTAVDAATAESTEAGQRVLQAFAERMSSLAVRQRAPNLLDSALVALVLGGLDTFAREALMIVPLVERSAEILGLDPVPMFEKAANVVGHPGSVSLMRWLSRPKAERSIATMKYVEDVDAQGFRYRLVW